jgi:RNA polymerase sigma-B factor
LLEAYQQHGERRARERLVHLYMPLVEALARRHERGGNEHDDLVQAGSIGLLNAIDRYDPRRGEEFAAFAIPTIAGEMKRHLRDRADAVRLPRRLYEARSRLPHLQQELTAELGRAPSLNELAAAAELSTEELARLQATLNGARDLDAEEQPDELVETESRLLLADAFRSLDDSERTILYLRFVRERSRREVAQELNISPSALTRRTTVALGKLRKELEGKAFAEGAHAAPAEPPPDGSGEPDQAQPGEQAPNGAPGPAEAEPTQEGKARASHSGRLMLRMPQSLHAELAKAAEREEVSLNQYITNALSAAVGWHSASEARAPQQPPSTPRWLPAAIVTNIVVVVVAGLVALILLVVAWQQGW